VPERKISFRQKNEYRIFKRRKQGFPAVQDDNKKRPIKILHVASHNSVRAGGSIQMMRLAIGLKQRGHDVYCAFNIKGGDDPSGLGTFGQLTGAGIKVSSFPMQRLRKYFGMFKFRRFLASHKFDIVHTHRFRALKFVYTASLGMDIPALLGNKKNSFPISPGQAKIYGSKKVDSIIVNAQLIKDLFAKTGRVDPDKVEIIYNGVCLELFHPGVDGSRVRESFGIENRVPLFGMIANFARKKSHDIFFEAAIKVLKEIPDVKFLLAGGGDYKMYQRQVKDSGFGDSFIFAGFRTDVPEVISALDFSLTSSRKGEGLTGSLVESMAMAKPVITTDVAGNSEFVKHKQTGLLATAGSVDMMADAMLYFLRNRKEAEAMGRNARAFVRDRVDNKKRTKRFEDLYHGILDRKGVN
jgi:glycosyltransferase involved in cell wall biosynthesis